MLDKKITISKQAIQEFKEIYKKESGKEISDNDAYDMAMNLLLAFKAVYKPIPKDQEKEFKKICREQDKHEASLKTKNHKTPKDI